MSLHLLLSFSIIAVPQHIQEARRRASELRAEQERKLAERRAAELAQTLATVTDVKAAGLEGGRESYTAPNSRDGGVRRRSRKASVNETGHTTMSGNLQKAAYAFDP